MGSKYVELREQARCSHCMALGFYSPSDGKPVEGTERSDIDLGFEMVLLGTMLGIDCRGSKVEEWKPVRRLL